MPPIINPARVDLESPLRNGRPVKYLVVHTAECAEYDGADVAVAAYLAGQPSSSIHCAIDNNSITPSVPEDRVAWAASNPLINNYALQAEWVGRADQGAAGWADAFSMAQIEVGASLYARWATEHGIPVRHGSVEDLRNGVPGFYGHDDSTKAWKNPDGHYDPGPTFPWDYFLARVRAYQGQTSNIPATSSIQTASPVPGVPMIPKLVAHTGLKRQYLVWFVITPDGREIPYVKVYVPDPNKVTMWNGDYKVPDAGSNDRLLDGLPVLALGQ